jgi:hypothetical protein
MRKRNHAIMATTSKKKETSCGSVGRSSWASSCRFAFHMRMMKGLLEDEQPFTLCFQESVITTTTTTTTTY